MSSLIGTGFQPGFLPAPQWRDENFDPLAITIPGNNDAPVALNIPTTDLFVASFPNSALTEIPVSGKEVNHDWVVGTNLVPHAHLLKATAAAGDIKMSMEYRIVESGITPVYGTATGIVAAPTNIWTDEARVDLTEIDMSTFTDVGAQVTFRLFRDPSDAADTYAGTVVVLSFGWHYQVNSSGSRTIGSK